MTDGSVLIVGAGPSGLAVSIGLAQFGIASTVIDRAPAIVDHPRGHVLNIRTMEIFRHWGIEPAIRARSLDPDVARRIAWTSCLGGPEIGSLVTTAEPEGLSPVAGVSCAQDRLEEILLIRARSLGVDVRYGVELVDVDTSTDTSVVAHLEDGSTLTANYLIAADGANSTIRKILDIEMDGRGALGAQINVAFNADLGPLLGSQEALLTWVISEHHPGVLINMGENRWVYNFGYDERHSSRESYDHAVSQTIIDELVEKSANPSVRSVHAWRLAAQVAVQYRSGRVFLCGDAAHRFPPTGGLGANTGIADAHNLSWKLAYHLRGWVEESALDSYEHERRPVALANTETSLRNARDITRTGAGPTAVSFGRTLAAGGPAALDLTRQIQEAIPEQLAHFSHIGQDLGYHYGSGQFIERNDRTFAVSDEGTYRPLTEAGHRLPHTWLDDGTSSLDLVSDRHRLIADSKSQAWRQRVSGNRSVTYAGLNEDALERLQCTAGGAVLVRPDGHVAGRWDSPDDIDQLRLSALCGGQGVVNH